jgi:tRNA (pseudouridine54-N1)-methyltransferase
VRRFVVVGHRAATDSNFPLNDLAGASGRMDLMARCVNAALLVSHGIREDTEITLCLLGPPNPPRTVRFRGSTLRGLNPDERSTAARIRTTLEYEGILEREVSPGIYASGMDLAHVFREIGSPVVLSESGSDVRGSPLPGGPFLLSDDRNLTPDEIAVAGRRLRINVGPRSLHADQVISVLHNELDRRETRG